MTGQEEPYKVGTVLGSSVITISGPGFSVRFGDDTDVEFLRGFREALNIAFNEGRRSAGDGK